jgi:hypothetical protein
MRLAHRVASSHLLAATFVLGFAALAGAAGCSDPVPPTPQGAFQATFVSDSASCMIAGHNTAVGAVTSSTKDKVLVSGIDGADIECTVSGSGTFSVQAKITQNGQGLEINIPKLTAGATKDSPATARSTTRRRRPAAPSSPRPPTPRATSTSATTAGRGLGPRVDHLRLPQGDPGDHEDLQDRPGLRDLRELLGVAGRATLSRGVTPPRACHRASRARGFSSSCDARCRAGGARAWRSPRRSRWSRRW